MIVRFLRNTVATLALLRASIGLIQFTLSEDLDNYGGIGVVFLAALEAIFQ